MHAFSVIAWLALALPASPALAAGTTPLAMVPQLDTSGNVAAGCKLNFFVAGTVATPQNAFADFALTQPLPNPLTCDQGGRVPMHWLADGLIHIRLTDFSGGPIVDTTVQVLGPSSGGGGGGGTVDPTTVLSTGDLKVKYGTGVISGFVRLNGLTIGNATSGATERANADTQAAFVYLYGVDPNLAVSGGRTGNALNDYNANKTIATPDWRGRAIAALDDMGNAPALRLTATYFGASSGSSGTTLGAAGGNESQTLTLTQTPAGIQSANPSQAISVFLAGNGSAAAVPPGSNISGVQVNPAGAGSIWVPTTGSNVWGGQNNSNTLNSITVVSTNTGGSPHPIVQPTMLATIYMKL